MKYNIEVEVGHDEDYSMEGGLGCIPKGWVLLVTSADWHKSEPIYESGGDLSDVYPDFDEVVDLAAILDGIEYPFDDFREEVKENEMAVSDYLTELVQEHLHGESFGSIFDALEKIYEVRGVEGKFISASWTGYSQSDWGEIGIFIPAEYEEKELLDEAAYIKGLIETIRHLIIGDVYYASVTVETENGREITNESCGGFIGDDWGEAGVGHFLEGYGIAETMWKDMEANQY